MTHLAVATDVTHETPSVPGEEPETNGRLKRFVACLGGNEGTNLWLAPCAAQRLLSRVDRDA